MEKGPTFGAVLFLAFAVQGMGARLDVFDTRLARVEVTASAIAAKPTPAASSCSPCPCKD